MLLGIMARVTDQAKVKEATGMTWNVLLNSSHGTPTSCRSTEKPYFSSTHARRI